MKKILIAFALVCLSLCFTGCQKSTQSLAKNNMSEITNCYYFAENDNFSLSISVGKRENPYLIDGVHHDTVDFSLLIFKDKSGNVKDKEIDCALFLNEEESELKLVYNPIANAYMFDLGYALDESDKIMFEFENLQLNLDLISNNFEISCQKAISIACEKFESTLNANIKNGKLYGECYIKVLGESGDNGNSLFWCFSFVSRDNRSCNIIISVLDGSILASDV